MTGQGDGVSVVGDPRLSGTEAKEPFVTVVVTCFNYAGYINSCLESIARQTYRHFKCIVVDDASTDTSVEVVEHFITSIDTSDGRFSLIVHNENKGQMGGFRTGLDHAEGPFVVYVDADDILLEDFIQTHVRAHMEYAPVAFTSSNQYQINEEGELIGGTHPDLKANGRFRYVLSSPIHSPYWVWATTSSMMFRRATLELIFPDSEDDSQYRICADNYICHFANLVGNSLLIPTVHGCYRRHGSNCFSANSMVGGCHPTGDMQIHPKAHMVRLNVFSILCSRREIFSRVLSSGRWSTLLAYTAGPIELIKNKSNIQLEKSFANLLMISTLLKGKQFLAYVFARLLDKFTEFDYGDKKQILKIPGR